MIKSQITQSLNSVRAFWRTGAVFIWFTASGVALSLLMVGGLLALLMINGLGAFWPAVIWDVQLQDKTRLIGEEVTRETIPYSSGPDHPEGRQRIKFRVGNRDVFGSDFRWVEVKHIASRTTPPELTLLERREWGPLLGRIEAIWEDDRLLAEGPAAWEQLPGLIRRANRLHDRIRHIEQDLIGDINYKLDRLRLKRRALVLDGTLTKAEAQQDQQWQADVAELENRYRRVAEELDALYGQTTGQHVGVLLADGQTHRLPISQVIRILQPNAMHWPEKSALYVTRLWEFLSDEPREANTEGGIFPAIFGTVMMVLIMTVAVTPFGVIAAIYLREYARQGLIVQLVRIAVNNLAGVPSIVFGVFGLGFFVYAIGGTIDHLFYPESLPNPTFGTGGIVWASLTLALLTLPVVIVATEEGLSAVPRDFREGSIALGATKLETLRQVVLPSALPGILTGLILAMARAAGEVAPLMLVGVVKLAPALPLDGHFPFLHLERKFMHLGFHIYDVGFQSPNVEAAKPMVYLTTLTLIVVVIALNLLAVTIRNRLRKRYAGSAV